MTTEVSRVSGPAGMRTARFTSRRNSGTVRSSTASRGACRVTSIFTTPARSCRVHRGGFRKLEEYLARAAERSGLQTSGTVRLSFRVTAQGVLADFEVDKSVSPEADKRAIEIIRDGPAWAPAVLHGYQPADGYAWVDVKFSPVIEL